MPSSEGFHRDVEAVLDELRANPALVDALYQPTAGERALAADRNAWRARAERAEAERDELRTQLAKTLDALAAGSALRERFVQRTLTAEAEAAELRRQVDAVRALAAEFQSERPSKIANVHFVASAILAALDGTADTQEAARG